MTLLSCATCQVNMAQGGGDAAGWSIFFLLFVILGILGGVIFMMVRIVKRGSTELDPELCDYPTSPSPGNR